MKLLQKHLQETIIEGFLPRFGNSADLLFVRDPQGKVIVADVDRLLEFGLPNSVEGKLTEIVAYSTAKNWLYLIEPTPPAGPITEHRKRALEQLTEACTAHIIYISAFLSREAFQEYACNIAWETEVWVAEFSDHMIHFDGRKFLGPHVCSESS